MTLLFLTSASKITIAFLVDASRLFFVLIICIYVQQEAKRRKVQLAELNEIVTNNRSTVMNRDDQRRKDAKVIMRIQSFLPQLLFGSNHV